MPRSNTVNANSSNADKNIENILGNLLFPNSNKLSLSRSNIVNTNSRNAYNNIETVLRNLMSPNLNVPILPYTVNAANSSNADNQSYGNHS